MLWKPIGKGSFGIVWKSRILDGPRKDECVAIKIINLDDFRDKSADEIRVIALLSNRKR
jgi:serine/threonine protein kinase